MNYLKYQLKLSQDKKKWLQDFQNQSAQNVIAKQASDHYSRENKIIGVQVPDWIEDQEDYCITVESYGQICDEKLAWHYLQKAFSQADFDWYAAFAKRYRSMRIILLEQSQAPLTLGDECNRQLIIVIATGADKHTLKIERQKGDRAFIFFVQENAQLTVHDQTVAANQSFMHTSYISYVSEGAHFNLIIENHSRLYERFFIATYLQKIGAQASMNIRHRGHFNERSSFNVIQHHQAPHTQSSLNLRSILNDQSHSFYTGSIIIDPECDGVDAQQYTKHLILDKHAHATAIPSLEVKSSQVQCRHGSAIGQIDQDALWYMQTRGITERRAQILIIDAFLSF